MLASKYLAGGTAMGREHHRTAAVGDFAVRPVMAREQPCALSSHFIGCELYSVF
jgi:hypothetical protein